MLRRICSERSQSLVEFSLVLPILLLLTLGIVDFAMGFKSYVELTNATREGARYAVVGNPPGTYPTDCTGADGGNVVSRVCKAADLPVADITNVSVACCTPDSSDTCYPASCVSGNSVKVSAHYHYKMITPLASIMKLVSGGSFDDGFDLASSSDMRLE
jgi:Flp pilus assembly protein TadG